MTSTLAGDSMHVPTLNLRDLLQALWRGVFKCDLSDNVKLWDWAVLTDDVWKQHGEEVVGCRPYIPGSFDWPPCNITLKINSGYKAKEWQSYLYGLALAILHNILPHKYSQKFCKLVHTMRIVHQRSIP